MSRTLEKKQAATELSGSRISPLAGKPAPMEVLVDLARLEKEYFDRKPDLEDANQFVVFGTSGHRGTSLNGTFTEAHVLAITQAICDYRKAQGISGPLYCAVFCAGSSRCEQCLRRNSIVWTTDKDGPIMDLLAAEITARTGKDPGVHYRELTAEFGSPLYTRIDAPASPDQKRKLQKLSADSVKETELAGQPIVARLTKARGNHAPIGGLKVVAKSGWFAALLRRSCEPQPF